MTQELEDIFTVGTVILLALYNIVKYNNMNAKTNIKKKNTVLKKYK